MRTTVFVVSALVVLAAGQVAQAQRRSGGTATFAISVTDPAGKGLDRVKVTLQGPASRDAFTEHGRIALEDLPLGTYRFRFERDGFVTLERDVVGRAGAPIDVKVVLTAVPPPPAPPPTPAPEPPAEPVALANIRPLAIDITEFITSNFVGRGAGKTSALACSTGGPAELIQVREPVAEHTHAGADEYLYVVAGAGAVGAAGREQPVQSGVFVLVPRGTPHTLVARGRTPLVVLSIRAGEACAPGGATR